MVGHLRPVGFRMPENDDPARFCDAHEIQLRMKQATRRRELTWGFATGGGSGSAGEEPLRAFEELGDRRVAARRVGLGGVEYQRQ